MENDTDVLDYFDEQIEQVKKHATAALEAFDGHAIHQARVATRRLKAGLDLLSPLMDAGQARPLQNAGKKLRRRLGPLRDLDVMIDHLQHDSPPPTVKPAQEWLIERLEKTRRDARIDDTENGQKLTKLLARFDGWWVLRHSIEASVQGIEPLIVSALHERMAAFAEQADWVSGVVAPPASKLPIDVHQVRIEGKALRYTFEIAAAHGLKIPKPVFKRFKAMQESLGNWHDYVVLCETASEESAERMLAHHEPKLAEQSLDLSKRFLRKASLELNKFRGQWKRSGSGIRAALDERVPLARDVATESKTDPDPSLTAQTQSPAVADGALPPTSQV